MDDTKLYTIYPHHGAWRIETRQHNATVSLGFLRFLVRNLRSAGYRRAIRARGNRVWIVPNSTGVTRS